MRQSGCGAGEEDGQDEKGEVVCGGEVAEEDGGEGEDGGDDDVDDEGCDDPFGIGGVALEFGEEEDAGDVGDHGDAGDGGLKVVEDPVGGGEAGLEVGRCGEEHVP